MLNLYLRSISAVSNIDVSVVLVGHLYAGHVQVCPCNPNLRKKTIGKMFINFVRPCYVSHLMILFWWFWWRAHLYWIWSCRPTLVQEQLPTSISPMWHTCLQSTPSKSSASCGWSQPRISFDWLMSTAWLFPTKSTQLIIFMFHCRFLSKSSDQCNVFFPHCVYNLGQYWQPYVLIMGIISWWVCAWVWPTSLF